MVQTVKQGTATLVPDASTSRVGEEGIFVDFWDMIQERTVHAFSELYLLIYKNPQSATRSDLEAGNESHRPSESHGLRISILTAGDGTMASADLIRPDLPKQESIVIETHTSAALRHRANESTGSGRRRVEGDMNREHRTKKK